MTITVQPRIKEHWCPTGKRETVQDYYTVRAGKTDYADYWGTKTDPDGIVRNRNSTEERDQFLIDHNEEILWLLRNITYRRRTLDFGAGQGWFLDAICDFPTFYAIEECSACHESLRNLGAVIVGDIADMDSSSLDLVICHHVIEHLIDPIYAIGHIHRVLKKGGWLMMSTPDFGSPCAKRFGDKFRLLHDPTHISLFTLESMSRMLRDYGFTIRETMFPFPERYATAENFARWNDTSKVSPPWPGNVFTMFCTRD